MKVPFVDLYAQYQNLKSEIDEAISEVIRTSAFIRGPYVDAFEAEFKDALGASHCVSCGNGTDALFIALKALNVRSGDEVITTAHSWISTSETITLAGGRVVFCDTDEETFTLNPHLLASKITGSTKGIVVVHLYGQPADIRPILQIAQENNLWVIEDCAQAHFAKYQGRYVGRFGSIATFSFYPGKNLGAMGDAGCIVTEDPGLSEFMTKFARHGGLKKGEHGIEGINSRLDGLQAAILSVKLRHISQWTKQRRRMAARYDELLAGIGDITRPSVADGRDHVFHLYVIRTSYRDKLRAFMKERGIETVINYPVALPFLPAYSYLRHQVSDFPVAYRNQSRILSLPIYPEITEETIICVCDVIREFFAEV